MGAGALGASRSVAGPLSAGGCMAECCEERSGLQDGSGFLDWHFSLGAVVWEWTPSWNVDRNDAALVIALVLVSFLHTGRFLNLRAPLLNGAPKKHPREVNQATHLGVPV